MENSIKLLILFILILPSAHAQLVPTGDIFCHRGGNGKFGISFLNDSIEIINLFNDRKRNKMMKSNDRALKLFELEGVVLPFQRLMGSNGYMNIKAYDSQTKTFLNLNIENLKELIHGIQKKVEGAITIFSTNLDPSQMIQEYRSPLRCELKDN